MPYSPDFNGIESYISLIKAQYKKLVLQKLVKDSEVIAVPLTKKSIEMDIDEKTRNYLSKCLSYIDEKL